MGAHIRFILVFLLLFSETRADLKKLLGRLNSQKWPWFGDRYPLRCPKPDVDWPRCYNPTPNQKMSVFERIGIHSDVKLAFELDVIFSAPAEKVDVCGRSVDLQEVKPFKLNPNGFAIKELLARGAEIYRKMPIVEWSDTLSEEHSLMFIDVGFIKVRGYIANVRNNGSNLLGQVLWPYTPPANPVKYRNPILILLIQESLSTAINREHELMKKNCIIRGIDKAHLQSCLTYLTDVMGAAPLKAVQVFYTDSTSEYEMYQACTEGSFCHKACAVHFKTYADQKMPDIKFLNVAKSNINMYVNLNVMAVRRTSYIACCNFVILEPYIFRGIPGDNTLVDDTAKLDNPYRAEFSGSGTEALDVDTMYSVLMVDPDAVYEGAKERPYGHLWTANFQYQDHYGTGTSIMIYAPPTPPNYVEHTYYILLFSHKKPVEKFPNGFYGEMEGCERRCMWDLSKLPDDFQLRGISWFKAKTDNYTLMTITGSSGAPCGPGVPLPPGMNPTACHPNIVQFDAIPALAMSLVYGGSLLESPDPQNPDFDYEDDVTMASCSTCVLANCGIMCFVVATVRSLLASTFSLFQFVT